jgi:lysophospholipase L1-like esterase
LVALGDSISAGVPLDDLDISRSSGAWVVQNLVRADPQSADARCQRSTKAWPTVLAVTRRFEVLNVACTGATLDDVLGRGDGAASQVDQVTSVATVVTLSVGVNDVGFLGALRICYLTVATCNSAAATAELSSKLDRFRQRLDSGLAEIVRRASPEAVVLVTTYYEPLPAGAQVERCSEANLAGGAAVLDGAEAAWLADGLRRLNDVIRSVAAATPRITLVELAGAFAGHQLCDEDPWIFGPSIVMLPGQLTSQAPMHPTSSGQQAIASAADRVLRAVRP